jgi:DNA (cytosine-5)-methyltransferase 1
LNIDNKHILNEFDIENKKDFFLYFKNNDYSTDGKKINQRLKQEKIITSNIYKDILKKIYFINKNKLNIYPNIEKVKGKDLIDLKIDIFTYSFPCQDLSSAGKRSGFKNKNGEYTRSGLLYEIKRILNEIFKISSSNKNVSLPKFLLLENVSTLFSNKYINEYLE